jgi:hypothetical protein
MLTVTDRQLAALLNGEAAIYKGRVIPIMRGGSDFEPEGGDALEPTGTDDTPVVEAETPADTPTEAAAPDYASDPRFLDAVRAEAAAIVNQRLPQPQQQAPPGEDVNWAERLNPLSDEFDPASFYEARDQYLIGQVRDMLAPVLEREQQARVDSGKQLMDQFIGDRWTAADGELTDDHKTAISDLAQSYLPSMNAHYGEGPMAAQQALIKATEAIRKINKTAASNGAQQNIDQLHAVTSLPGEPGGGSAAARNVMPHASSFDQLMNNFFGSPAAA